MYFFESISFILIFAYLNTHFSLPKDVVYMSQNKEASNSTAYYTQSTHATQFNSDENFLKQACVISLADMKKLKQVSHLSQSCAK
jgi:hypothetical protein